MSIPKGRLHLPMSDRPESRPDYDDPVIHVVDGMSPDRLAAKWHEYQERKRLAALRESVSDPSPIAMSVYEVFASLVNDEDSIPAAWPSSWFIAAELDLPRQDVREAIKALVKHRWLVRVDERDWLPRWQDEIDDDRVKFVRVFRLPRYPAPLTAREAGVW